MTSQWKKLQELAKLRDLENAHKRAEAEGRIILPMECSLCKRPMKTDNTLLVEHVCRVRFVSRGANPCKHRGSVRVGPVEGISLKVHACVICDFTWMCPCQDCVKTGLKLAELLTSGFEGSPVWPSPVQCPCKSRALRTVFECPRVPDEDDDIDDESVEWLEGCEVEYPHYHVKCFKCEGDERVEADDIEPHRYKGMIFTQ